MINLIKIILLLPISIPTILLTSGNRAKYRNLIAKEKKEHIDYLNKEIVFIEDQLSMHMNQQEAVNAVNQIRNMLSWTNSSSFRIRLYDSQTFNLKKLYLEFHNKNERDKIKVRENLEEIKERFKFYDFLKESLKRVNVIEDEIKEILDKVSDDQNDIKNTMLEKYLKFKNILINLEEFNFKLEERDAEKEINKIYKELYKIYQSIVSDAQGIGLIEDKIDALLKKINDIEVKESIKQRDAKSINEVLSTLRKGYLQLKEYKEESNYIESKFLYEELRNMYDDSLK